MISAEAHPNLCNNPQIYNNFFFDIKIGTSSQILFVVMQILNTYESDVPRIKQSFVN